MAHHLMIMTNDDVSLPADLHGGAAVGAGVVAVGHVLLHLDRGQCHKIYNLSTVFSNVTISQCHKIYNLF